VINKKDGVGKETRQRVESIINELNYSPDPMAQDFATRRNNVIGVITQTFTGEINGRILEGVTSYANEKGFRTFITTAKQGEGHIDASGTILKKQRIEGLLITSRGAVDDSFKILSELPSSLPVVTLGYGKYGDRVVSVEIKNTSGAYMAVDHLIKNGSKRVASITGPSRLYEVQDRNKGYELALQDNSLTCDERLLEVSSWSVEGGYEATKRLLSRNIRFDGLFAHNDLIAIGAAFALKEAHLRIPQDIQVIGFDDLPLGQYVEPSLSTVHRPSFRLGHLAVNVLLDMIASKSQKVDLTAYDQNLLEPHLVIRNSTMH
jgi:DNA-binding LacI/PurR family transcriptional regulator